MPRRFTDPTAALHALLDIREAQPQRKLDVILYPDYDGMRDGRAVESFEETLRQAERLGAIRLEMGKRLQSHAIERIRLIDPVPLYALLGRRPAADIAAAAAGKIAEALGGDIAEWLASEIEEARARWAILEDYHGLGASEGEEAITLFRLLLAIDRGDHEGLDRRRLGVQAVADSKAVESHERRLGTILKAAFGLEIPAMAVLDHLGIASYVDPVWIRGPLVLKQRDSDFPLGVLMPFAAIPPESVPALACDKVPDYVLMIENKTSFNHYVRRIRDDGIVLYTGGFPSRAVRACLDGLASSAAARAPWYHWGDIDAGGVRIFRHIETHLAERAGIALRPHLMTRELAERYGHRGSPIGALRRLAATDSAIAGLAAYLAGQDADAVSFLEQEAIEPAAPGSGAGLED